MDEKLERQLIKDYPSIYRDYNGDMSYTCMCWGFACGNGWFHIINDLSEQITKIEKKYKIEIVADQVKEKFGGLRFYYHVNNSKPFKGNNWFQNLMYDKKLAKQYWLLIEFRKKFWKNPEEKVFHLVGKAETLSYDTCEVCGKPGHASGGSWVITLCDDCKNKRKK